MGSLNPKQEKFCHEYIKDFNGTRAAIASGYSKNGAEVRASELLRNSKVKNFLSSLMSKLESKALITKEEIINDLIEIKNRCMQKVAVMEFDHESKSMLQNKDEDGNGVWEFDAKGATKSLELLGKHIGMFVEKVELTGKLSTIQIVTSGKGKGLLAKAQGQGMAQ